METLGRVIPIMLIDNGFGLNVFSLKIITCLGLGLVNFMPFDQIGRAYDNIRREMLDW